MHLSNVYTVYVLYTLLTQESTNVPIPKQKITHSIFALTSTLQ